MVLWLRIESLKACQSVGKTHLHPCLRLVERQAECATCLPIAASVSPFAFDDNSLLALRTGLTHNVVVGLEGLWCGWFGRVRDFCCGLGLGLWVDLSFGFWCGCLLLGDGFLEVVFGGDGDVAVGVVGQHLVNDLGYLRFQLVNKLLRIVVAVLDVAQFLFPNAS